MLVSIDKERVKLALTEFTHSITIAVVISGDVSYDFMSEGTPAALKTPDGFEFWFVKPKLMYR